MLDFVAQMTGSRPIEVIAVFCGLANVSLIIRRSIWNQPFGFLMVVLYARIFYDYQLYSDALLQVYFFLIQFYGLYYWLKGRADDGTWYSGDPEVRDWFFTKLGVLLSELKLPFQEVDGGDWLSRKSLAKEQIDVFLRRYQ